MGLYTSSVIEEALQTFTFNHLLVWPVKTSFISVMSNAIQTMDNEMANNLTLLFIVSIAFDATKIVKCDI